jgi:hypothetical protein
VSVPSEKYGNITDFWPKTETPEEHYPKDTIFFSSHVLFGGRDGRAIRQELLAQKHSIAPQKALSSGRSLSEPQSLNLDIRYSGGSVMVVTQCSRMLAGLHVLGYIMLYLSACINPIIYVIMNKQYRQAYKTVLLWRRPRLLSLTPVGSSFAGQCSSLSILQF